MVEGLTAKQKAKLPLALQKAILASRAKKGKKVPKKETGGELKKRYQEAQQKMKIKPVKSKVEKMKKGGMCSCGCK